MIQANQFSSGEPIPTLPISESYWVIPGSLLAGEYPLMSFDQESASRRLDAFLEAGFTTFINLTCEFEADDYSKVLKERADNRGAQVECLRFSIGDFGLPTRVLMNEILNAIDAALGSGRKVYLHCYGGIGRTGTSVGCFLVRRGMTGQQALRVLAGWWQCVPKSARHPHSPETQQQEKFVLSWPD